METKFNKVTPEIVELIRNSVKGKVSVGPDVNPDYTHDEMPIYGSGSPDVLVEAKSTEEVAAIMKICYDNNINVIARGAGTGLVGASVAINGGVMIDMQSFNRILDYDLNNFVVTVEPGVLLNDLAADAAQKGFLYPPDPGEKFATLGGNVSTNAGGMRAVKYGTTRDYVKKMEVVLPTGKVVEFGANVTKTSTGYSLLNLMIGSEGTLGIITKLVLKIVPAPTEDISLIVPYENLNDCIATVPELFKHHLNPQSIEFMERAIVESSERFLGKKNFPTQVGGVEVGAFLLVRFDGNDADQLLEIVEKAAELVLENGALDVFVADTPEKKKSAWEARGAFLEAIEAETELYDECDVVVPISEIANYLAFVNEKGRDFSFEVKSFGHAGDGNLHIYACSNDMEKEAFIKEVDEFMDIIYDKAYEVGGQLSGEHGIGHGKTKYLAKFEGDAKIELMRGIKKVFDPKGILNPGKVI
ncbi:FAD-binding oxidoreductase [Peptoniphilaceae bacterium SGI.131]